MGPLPITGVIMERETGQRQTLGRASEERSKAAAPEPGRAREAGRTGPAGGRQESCPGLQEGVALQIA